MDEMKERREDTLASEFLEPQIIRFHLYYWLEHTIKFGTNWSGLDWWFVCAVSILLNVVNSVGRRRNCQLYSNYIGRQFRAIIHTIPIRLSFFHVNTNWNAIETLSNVFSIATERTRMHFKHHNHIGFFSCTNTTLQVLHLQMCVFFFCLVLSHTRYPNGEFFNFTKSIDMGFWSHNLKAYFFPMYKEGGLALALFLLCLNGIWCIYLIHSCSIDIINLNWTIYTKHK